MTLLGQPSPHGWHAGLRIVGLGTRPHTCILLQAAGLPFLPGEQTGSLSAVPLWKVIVGPVPTRLRRARKRPGVFHCSITVVRDAPKARTRNLWTRSDGTGGQSGAQGSRVRRCAALRD